MQLRNSRDRYGGIAQALHWATAVLLILAWVLGMVGDDLPGRAARAAGLFVHMSAGLAVLLLLLARLAWRLADPPPPLLESTLGPVGAGAAKLGHAGLYLLAAGVPLLGIVVQFARGRGIPVFGVFEIASPWPVDRAFARSMKGLHELAANSLMVFAALHAATALVHEFVLGDATLRRMLPRRLVDGRPFLRA